VVVVVGVICIINTIEVLIGCILITIEVLIGCILITIEVLIGCMDIVDIVDIVDVGPIHIIIHIGPTDIELILIHIIEITIDQLGDVGNANL